MDTLINDVYGVICSYLNIWDIYNACLVFKSLNKFCNTNGYIWKLKIIREYGPIDTYPKTLKSWKNIFRKFPRYHNIFIFSNNEIKTYPLNNRDYKWGYAIDKTGRLIDKKDTLFPTVRFKQILNHVTFVDYNNVVYFISGEVLKYITVIGYTNSKIYYIDKNSQIHISNGCESKIYNHAIPDCIKICEYGYLKVAQLDKYNKLYMIAENKIMHSFKNVANVFCNGLILLIIGRDGRIFTPKSIYTYDLKRIKFPNLTVITNIFFTDVGSITNIYFQDMNHNLWHCINDTYTPKKILSGYKIQNIYTVKNNKDVIIGRQITSPTMVFNTIK